jgi:hypothetical protein
MNGIILFVCCVFLLSGCTTIYGKEWNRTFFSSDLNKVSLGEDKASVVNKLGGVYASIASEIKDDHKFEVLEFNEKPDYVGRVNKAYWMPYWLYFMDDKLVKYERATQQALLEHAKWMDEVQGTALTMEAFKGTSVMPYQHKVEIK